MDKTGPHRTVPLGGIFVTGTDTNVGKTVLTAALGIALQREGFHLGVMKPIETGTKHLQSGQQTDGERLQRLLMPFLTPLLPFRPAGRFDNPLTFNALRTNTRPFHGIVMSVWWKAQEESWFPLLTNRPWGI